MFVSPTPNETSWEKSLTCFKPPSVIPCAAEAQRSKLLQPLVMLKTGVGDLGIRKFKVVEIGQASKVIQSRISHLRSA